jgi:cardiolipin synthase A/B
VAEFQKLFLDTWLKQKGPKLSEGNYFPDLKEEGNALVRVVGSTPGQTTGFLLLCMCRPSHLQSIRSI